MLAMETTLTALRAQAAETQRTLAELRGQLAESRESRYLNPVVYVLIGLLVLALAAIAMLMRSARQRAAATWWNDSVVREDDPAGSGGAGSDKVRTQPAPLAASGLSDASASDSAGTLRATGAVDPGDDDEGDLTPVRNVNTEELFDVQQQSDFFLSLGQHAQAIAVLSEHIAENPQTSALAYLDLLRIHHSLGNRDAYGRVGQEFERVFNATLPSFDNFNDGGNGLEHYRGTLSRITEQWPGRETLMLIEELVFRRPGTDGNEAFDLAAYQELLLLYAVAKEVIDPDSAPPAPVTPLSFLDTAAQVPTTAPSPLAPVVATGATMAAAAATVADVTPALAPAPAPVFLEPLAFTVDPEPTRPAAFMPYETAERAGDEHGDRTAAAEAAPAFPYTAEPSIFGALEDHAERDQGEETHPGDLEGPTARVPLFPDAPLLPSGQPPSGGDTVMEPVMNTSMDTISELKPEKPIDSNLIDFDLFDPEIEAKIAPKPTRY